MADLNIDQVKEFLGNLTVLELSELVSQLEEAWGVSAAAPMVMGAMPGAGGDAGGAEEEQTEFDAILTSWGDKKIQVIKVVREITGLGLKEAKALVDEAPKPVKEAISKDEANEVLEKIEAAGGSIEIK